MAIPLFVGAIFYAGIKYTIIAALTTVIQGVVAFTLYLVFRKYNETIVSWAFKQVFTDHNLSSAVVEMHGIGAWIAECLRFNDCLSMIFSFLLTGFFTRMIRF